MLFLVTAIFLYACESWTFTVELQSRTQAMEMRCYRKILRISHKDHATNEEVRAKIQRAIGPHEDLDDRKETQTAVACTCLLFIRSGQSHLARHSYVTYTRRDGSKQMGLNHALFMFYFTFNRTAWIGCYFDIGTR